MSIDDDTVWLEVLAGRRDSKGSEADSGSTMTVQEALALRECIRSQQSDLVPTEALVNPAREAQLIERASAAGLIVTPRRWLADRRIAWSVAAMLIVVVGGGIWRSLLPEPETLRGVVDGTIHLEARDPLALKRQLTEELALVGVQVHGYERLGHLGLDADLPLPVAPAVAQVLERHHLPVPVDGALVIEIDPPSRR
jgi:hypothetical protein